MHRLTPGDALTRKPVGIANHVLTLPDEAFAAEVDYLVSSVHTKNIPAKRAVDRHYRLEQVGLVGGHRLKTCSLIWPILVRGAAMAGRKIDIQAAAFAQLADHLQKTRPDPRIPLARAGHLDLSDIWDQTEPDSFVSLIKAPEVTAVATSPMKRAAQPTSPIAAKPARLSETKIELLPASTPRTELSPTKSSPPSASCADTPAPRKIVATSPTLETLVAGSLMRVVAEQMPSSPLRPNTAAGAFEVLSDDDDPSLTPKAHAAFMAPSYGNSTSSPDDDTLHQGADAQAGYPLAALDPDLPTSRCFKVPSEDGSTLSLGAGSSEGARDQTGNDSPTGVNASVTPRASKVVSPDASAPSPADDGEKSLSTQSFPVNFSRPFPSTPVRPYQLEEATPHKFVHTPPPRTRDDLDEPTTSLLDTIPPSSPSLPVPTLGGLDMSKSTDFDFGKTTSCFNSPSPVAPLWANPHRSGRAQNSLRRRSEPLFRTFFKSRADSRMSASPKKVTFQNDLVNEGPPGSRGRSPQYQPWVSNASAHPQHDLRTPEIVISPAVAVSGAATPAISWAQMTGRAASDALGQSTPQTTNQVNDRENVFSVDMHRNTNIFGGEGTPAKRSATAVAQLARIAEAHCDGQAQVVVTQEHGRLFVRFKLPTKFAFMFPQDQGFDESRFSTTPSISSSPRIKVKNHYVPGAAPVSSPRPSPLRTPIVDSAHHNDTMVCDDFAPSTPGVHTQDRDSFAEYADESRSLSFDATADFHIDEHSTTIAWQQISSLRLDPPENDAATHHSAHHDPMDASDSPLTDLASMEVELTPVPHHTEVDDAAHERMSTHSDVEMSDEAVIHENSTTANTRGTALRHGRLSPSYRASPYHIAKPITQSDEDDERNDVPLPKQSQGPSDGGQRISPGYRANPYYMTRTIVQTSGDGYGRDDELRDQERVGNGDEHDGHGRVYGSRGRDHDSPGRDYMRDFISRTRPKTLSATETGSPVALPARRQPLGVKDPNTESPLMGMRRTQADEQEAQSPFKRGAAPVLRHQSFDQDQAMGGTESTKPTRAGKKGAKAQESDEEMADAPAARRSSRLRTLRRPMAAPKSSIPTSIRVSSRSGSGRGHTAKPKSRPGQQDVSQQTRINTRKNRGEAEYPAQLLARSDFDDTQVDTQAGHPSKATRSSRDTKSVGWKEPLVSHQDEAAGRGRAKAKATQGCTGVEKLPRPDAAARKKRSAQVATGLGMSTRGTPSKAGPMTRAAARAQK